MWRFTKQQRRGITNQAGARTTQVDGSRPGIVLRRTTAPRGNIMPSLVRHVATALFRGPWGSDKAISYRRVKGRDFTKEISRIG